MLSGLTAALAIVALVPLFVTPFLPLKDLPDHVGAASVVGDILFGDGLPAYHYELRPLAPYWTLYLLLAAGNAVAGPLLAAKLVVGLAILMVPLSMMRLMVALRRSPRLALWAFALVWDHNMYWGWVAHTIGIALAIFALAKIVEARDTREALRAWPWTALACVTHLYGAGLVLVGGLALTLGSSNVRRRLAIHGIAIATGFAALLPFVVASVAAKPPGPPVEGWGFQWHSLSHKVHHLFQYTLNNIPGPAGLRAAGVTFACVLIAPVWMRMLPSRRSGPEDRGAAMLCLAALGLYLALPFMMRKPIEHWYTYPRMGTVFLLFMLVVPKPRLDRWRVLALVPGVVAVILMSAAVTKQFDSFGQRAAPFLKIIDAVEPNRSVLTLTLRDSDPAVFLPAYNQFHAYIIAAKRGYDTYLFDHPSMPVGYRRDRELPRPEWNRMSSFSFAQHGRHFDYILVQGKRWDPLRRLRGGQVKRVAEVGRWRLYRVLARAKGPG